METIYQFYQLSLPARGTLENVFLTEAERERLKEFFQQRLKEDPALQEPRDPGVSGGLTEEQEILDCVTHWAISGKDAFNLLYRAGFRLISSASVGGCKASATMEHFFVKEFKRKMQHRNQVDRLAARLKKCREKRDELIAAQ